MLVGIWLCGDMWSDGWVFGAWLADIVAGKRGSWRCTIGVKKGDVWFTESCVAIGWNVNGIGKGVASGTIPISGLGCRDGSWMMVSMLVVDSKRGGWTIGGVVVSIELPSSVGSLVAVMGGGTSSNSFMERIGLFWIPSTLSPPSDAIDFAETMVFASFFVTQNGWRQMVRP